MLSAHWVLSAVLSVDFLLILSVPVRLSATSLSEVALKVWASPLHFKCHCGPRQPNWAKCKWCTCTVCAMAWCMLSRDRVSLFPLLYDACLSVLVLSRVFFAFFWVWSFTRALVYFSFSFNTCGFSGFIFVPAVLLFTLTFVNNNKPSFCLAVLVLLIGIVLVQGCSYCALLCLCRSRGGHVLVCDNACVEALYIPRFNSLGGPLLV